MTTTTTIIPVHMPALNIPEISSQEDNNNVTDVKIMIKLIVELKFFIFF